MAAGHREPAAGGSGGSSAAAAEAPPKPQAATTAAPGAATPPAPPAQLQHQHHRQNHHHLQQHRSHHLHQDRQQHFQHQQHNHQQQPSSSPPPPYSHLLHHNQQHQQQQQQQQQSPLHHHQQPHHQQHKVDSLPSISSFHSPSPPQPLHPHAQTSISLPPPSLFAPGPPPPSFSHMASQAPPPPPSHHPPPQQQQQQQQQMAMQPQAGYYPPPSQPMMAQGPPGAQHPQYGPPPPGYDQGYGRLALPGGARMTGQRTPGKEIKRRTKTGCLTCRKRRIKCDEGHPQCKNCIKSKRECAGYDPMFKPHPQGNQSIRPAASDSGSISAPAAHPPPSYAPPPPAGAQPLPLPPASAPGAPPQPAAIDPSLQQHQQQPQHHASAPPPQLDKFGAGIDDPGHPKLIAKPTRMDDLISIGNGREPPAWQRSEPIADAERAGAEEIYLHIFAYGLDLFFETEWFRQRGWAHLVNDTSLLEKMVLLRSRMGFTPNTPEWDHSLSLEGHIIWDLILLCRHVSTSINTTNAADVAQDLEDGSNVHDLAARTHVFEMLITNQYVEAPDVIPAPADGLNADAVDPALKDKANERADRMQTFWHSLSRFCSLKEPEAQATPQEGERAAAAAASEIDGCLAAMRSVLDQIEPRDIMYSVAIARHLMRPAAVDAHRPVRSNDESDPATQLHIARSFIYQETRMGTSPVMTRLARMVIRSWAPAA